MTIVAGIGKPVLICGWIEASEGKRIGRIIDPKNAGKPMYIVPQCDLWPMQDLKRIVDMSKVQS